MLIYKNLGELLDSYTHMIIPFLCKIIIKDKSTIDHEVRKEIITLIVTLA